MNRVPLQVNFFILQVDVLFASMLTGFVYMWYILSYSCGLCFHMHVDCLFVCRCTVSYAGYFVLFRQQVDIISHAGVLFFFFFVCM